jgi:aryl-alcohol dehydrogenase-like predicted oxidoreductase
MKIRLGTANFGQKYGITKNNFVGSLELKEILNCAKDLSILAIDTASGYGASERLLGKNLPNDIDWDICTKIRLTTENYLNIHNLVHESIRNLGGRKVKTVLIHNVYEYKDIDYNQVNKQFVNLVEEGVINNFGISAYDLGEIEYFKKLFPMMTFFQLPDNICSQKYLDNSFLLKLKESNNTIDVRSIFLQGILLLPTNADLQGNKHLIPFVEKFHIFAHKVGKSPIEICIQYAKNLRWADSMVVGIRTKSELDAIHNFFTNPNFLLKEMPEKTPENFTDPRSWNLPNVE